ncbi:nematocyst expressed protein 3-like [Ochotona princeps]|uniref:nematocyst expressed protein 3-like n=1 Tax=Ochotona princeps TaxID=9978 RepID=UPI0027153E30|nr:nematocyst expressed protein 3-like [Ochotona princeps]
MKTAEGGTSSPKEAQAPAGKGAPTPTAKAEAETRAATKEKRETHPSTSAPAGVTSAAWTESKAPPKAALMPKFPTPLAKAAPKDVGVRKAEEGSSSGVAGYSKAISVAGKAAPVGGALGLGGKGIPVPLAKAEVKDSVSTEAKKAAPATPGTSEAGVKAAGGEEMSPKEAQAPARQDAPTPMAKAEAETGAAAEEKKETPPSTSAPAAAKTAAGTESKAPPKAALMPKVPTPLTKAAPKDVGVKKAGEGSSPGAGE